MQVAIVKYNAGNIYSVDCALRRVGITPILTDDKEALMAADKVIFPGVGEAATTMTYLREQGLDRLIRDLRQPVLGIYRYATHVPPFRRGRYRLSRHIRCRRKTFPPRESGTEGAAYGLEYGNRY